MGLVFETGRRNGYDDELLRAIFVASSSVTPTSIVSMDRRLTILTLALAIVSFAVSCSGEDPASSSDPDTATGRDSGPSARDTRERDDGVDGPTDTTEESEETSDAADGSSRDSGDRNDADGVSDGGDDVSDGDSSATDGDSRIDGDVASPKPLAESRGWNCREVGSTGGLSEIECICPSGSKCGTLPCGDDELCDAVCKEGSTCDVECSGLEGSGCSVDCAAETDCSIDCSSGFGSCALVACGANATCSQTCGPKGCSMRCDGASASCTQDCSPSGAPYQCSLRSCSPEAKKCCQTGCSRSSTWCSCEQNSSACSCS